MIKTWKHLRIELLLLIILFSLSTKESMPVAAQADEPPTRQTTLVVSYTKYEWWLITWNGNQIVCVITSEQGDLPTDGEIIKACGQSLYDGWKKTTSCPQADQGKEAAATCPGMYLFQVGSQSGERTIFVDLPEPSLSITLTNCSPVSPGNLCEVIPALLLTGEEPLPNEQIIAIHTVMDGISNTCIGVVCEIPLRATLPEGLTIEFWADSSFGDSSKHFTALVRVMDSGVSESPGNRGWYVDVLSTQWRGEKVESCAKIWDAFPTVGGATDWLITPPQQESLASDRPYYYLAGRLISKGLVNVEECPMGGMLPNGYANACGLEKARPMVELWQNQFDPRIFSVADEIGLPAQLLKRLFAQESQFWPGVFRVAREYGLGQLTDQGADTILLWNPSFFDQFCPLMLDKSVCARGYLKLKEEDRAILRGALALEANADCQNCPTGIDLTRADFSVALFGQSLIANCGQVSRTVYNATHQSPGAVSDYEDLWRFTLANYNAGPGCLAYAIYTTVEQGEALNWENVSTHFTEPCQRVINYVDLITR